MRSALFCPKSGGQRSIGSSICPLFRCVSADSRWPYETNDVLGFLRNGRLHTAWVTGIGSNQRFPSKPRSHLQRRMEYQQVAGGYETAMLEAFTLRWKILLASRPVAPSFPNRKLLLRQHFPQLSSLTARRMLSPVCPSEGNSNAPLNYQAIEVLPCIKLQCFAHLL